MLKKLLIVTALFFSLHACAQNYNNILNYYYNETPSYGVKIKTNLPFTPGAYMADIHIKGYNYGGQEPIDLSIVFYLYSNANDFWNPKNYYVHNSGVSSARAYTPILYLGNENGKAVIYINDKVYHQRFTVSVFNNYGQNQDSWYQGWTVVDEPFNGTQSVELPYRNRFKGDIFLSGNSIWNANLEVGTLTPTKKLAVNGNIRTKEIKVENSNWPDYVFSKTYQLPTLEETEQQILKLGHLLNIPSAEEVKEQGVNLGDLNAKLLQKLEEVTLHLIKLKKENTRQQNAIAV